MNNTNRLSHGTCIATLAEHYAIPAGQWLDLSTGINPHVYPIPELPADLWSALPSEQDGLLQAAQKYFGCDSVLPVPGSQWAIEQIPVLLSQLIELPQARVLVPKTGYLEHAWVWARHDCQLDCYDQIPDQEALAEADICVLIQPNNPLGAAIEQEQMLALHAAALEQGTLLIVDEAFIDAESTASMCAEVHKGQLIVLRSLGKFFGLAGLRVGAVAAWPEFLSALKAQLSLWPISGPARYIATQAWQDRNWQNGMRERLQTESNRLADLLSASFQAEVSGCALFQSVWLKPDQAEQRFQQLCEQGVAARLLEDALGQKIGLRFGLPGTTEGWQKLEQALGTLVDSNSSDSIASDSKDDLDEAVQTKETQAEQGEFVYE